MWFGKYAPQVNQKYPKMDNLAETFYHGGYYRYDLDHIDEKSKLSVISLNSIYFHVRNREDPLESWR